jgi:hypothetical protein
MPMPIMPAAHYATDLQLACNSTSCTWIASQLQGNRKWPVLRLMPPHTMQLACNSIGFDHAQFNRKKNRARVHILNLAS